MYCVVYSLRPQDFPRPSRCPSGFALGKSFGPREISWSSGMYNPIHPSSQQCTDTILFTIVIVIVVISPVKEGKYVLILFKLGRAQAFCHLQYLWKEVLGTLSLSQKFASSVEPEWQLCLPPPQTSKQGRSTSSFSQTDPIVDPRALTSSFQMDLAQTDSPGRRMPRQISFGQDKYFISHFWTREIYQDFWTNISLYILTFFSGSWQKPIKGKRGRQ